MVVKFHGNSKTYCLNVFMTVIDFQFVVVNFYILYCSGDLTTAQGGSYQSWGGVGTPKNGLPPKIDYYYNIMPCQMNTLKCETS